MNPPHIPASYCSSVVHIGDVPLGGNYPVRIQTMTNTPTLDTRATVEQCLSCYEAGAEYVRITAPGVREAEHLEVIRKELRRQGCRVPLIADIHFQPAAAEAAARRVEKVRINPGNYVDRRTASAVPLTPVEYDYELERIHQRLLPLISICKDYGTAVRIGSNHGSLSARIMERYGDTPEGMAESAMEFLRIFRAEGFDQVVLSMKSSNVRIMVESTRLLVQKMVQEDMAFPLHLGVTEAGAGSDGRIKSASGIGTLLADGLGDTIRVSLTEAPELELPVCRTIVQYLCGSRNHQPGQQGRPAPSERQTNTPFSERISTPSGNILPSLREASELVPHEEKHFFWARETFRLNGSPAWLLQNNHSPGVASFRESAKYLPAENPYPVILKKTYPDCAPEELQIKAACDFGPLFNDRAADGIWLETTRQAKEPNPTSESPHKKTFPPDPNGEMLRETALAILQACRERISKTEYISCPSCGRTLFDLAETAAAIRERTQHLKGLKIGIMGCIVNGPGEMADADFGFVGSGPGKITLYRGREVVKKNIPSEQAVDELIDLIRQDGFWRDPGEDGPPLPVE